MDKRINKWRQFYIDNEIDPYSCAANTGADPGILTECAKKTKLVISFCFILNLLGLTVFSNINIY